MIRKEKITGTVTVAAALTLVLAAGTGPAAAQSILDGKIRDIGKSILGGKKPKVDKLLGGNAPSVDNPVAGGGRPAPPRGLNDQQGAAYDKLVDAADSVAALTYKHEHPDYDAPSYAGPVDPFKGPPNEANLVLKKILACQDAAAAALATGIPGTTPISYPTRGTSLISPTPLQDMSAKVCGKYEKLAESNSSDGKRRPFLNVLTGDRKKVFENDPDMHTRAVKGPGGRNLRTPQEFASSPRWYTYGHVADSFPERWYIHGWIFNGNKLVREIDKEGWGRHPPSSAFN